MSNIPQKLQTVFCTQLNDVLCHKLEPQWYLFVTCASTCVCVRAHLCRRFEMDREPAEARFCAECNRCHSAEEGDLWAESSMLGLRITYFACMDGKVYDITGERKLLSVVLMNYWNARLLSLQGRVSGHRFKKYFLDALKPHLCDLL